MGYSKALLCKGYSRFDEKFYFWENWRSPRLNLSVVSCQLSEGTQSRIIFPRRLGKVGQRAEGRGQGAGAGGRGDFNWEDEISQWEYSHTP